MYDGSVQYPLCAEPCVQNCSLAERERKQYPLCAASFVKFFLSLLGFTSVPYKNRILFSPVELGVSWCCRNKLPIVRLWWASCRRCPSVGWVPCLPYPPNVALLWAFVSTCSLAGGVLGVFTSDEPRGSRYDAAFVVGALGGEKHLHSSNSLSLVRSAMLRGWRTEVCVWLFPDCSH